MDLRGLCIGVPITKGREMHIGKNDLLAGVPAKRLRDALTKMGNDSWSRKKLREELKLSPQATMDILRGLRAEGYLEASDRLRGWFRTGPADTRVMTMRDAADD